MKKKINGVLLYLLFIAVCLFINYTLKERIHNATLKIVFRDFILMTILIAPTWLASIWVLPILNKKKIATRTFLLRILRNIILALSISIITTVLLFFVRIYIYNSIGASNVFNKFIVNFLVNISIIQFIEYYIYFIKAKNEVIKIEKEKNKILKLQHKVLKEQINPHFLFNSLNVLSSLIYDSQDKANQYTKELSKLYRYILSTNQKDLVPLTKELQFIKSYFYILQLRFVDSISLNINIKNQIEAKDNFSIVPLTLQLLVENAIKHNSFSKETILNIEIEIKDNLIIVSNNKNKKQNIEISTGKGLEYIKTLYKKFNKSIQVSEDENFYTVTIPLLKVNHK